MLVAEGGYEFRAFVKVEDLKACLFTGGNEPGELSLIHISEPTRRKETSRMPSSA